MFKLQFIGDYGFFLHEAGDIFETAVSDGLEHSVETLFEVVGVLELYFVIFWGGLLIAFG